MPSALSFPALNGGACRALGQVGKTTLLLQQIATLLEAKVPAANILYVTFDHPLLKDVAM